MKRIFPPKKEPKELTLFCKKSPLSTWKKFRRTGNVPIIFQALAKSQGFICAYCEIDLQIEFSQVEHFIPKSDSSHGYQGALDFHNMLACCVSTKDGWRNKRPFNKTMRCGQKKGNLHPEGKILDPRKLPIDLFIWKISRNGKIEVNANACFSANISPEIAQSTIDELGLNNEHMKGLRQQRWNFFDEELQKEIGNKNISDEDLEEIIFSFMKESLSLDENGSFENFWSTTRAWGGSIAEEFLASQK